MEPILREQDTPSDVTKSVVYGWLFMTNPISLPALLFIYMLFVLKIGPNFMKNRKPYHLHSAVIIYNLFQIFFNSWILYQVIVAGMYLIPNGLCYPKRTIVEHLPASWYYFFSKVLDLIDTLFFVLRKKQNQISFLHVYHHAVTCLGTWVYTKYAPSEQGWVLALVNSMVHVVMYFYYFLSITAPTYTKNAWWKKYITWMQLGQFIIVVVYLILVLVLGCNNNKSISAFLIIHLAILIVLFGHFYRKSYKVKN